MNLRANFGLKFDHFFAFFGVSLVTGGYGWLPMDVGYEGLQVIKSG